MNESTISDEPTPTIFDSAWDRLTLFSERLLALYLDLTALQVLLLGPFLLADYFGTNILSGGMFGLLFLIFFFIYQIFFIVWKSATPGKMVLGLRVQQNDGSPWTYSRSAVRALSYLVDFASLGLGFFWSLFNPQKRAWHDSLSKSQVIATRTYQGWRLIAIRFGAGMWIFLVVFSFAYRFLKRPALDDAAIIQSARNSIALIGTLEDRYRKANGGYALSLSALAGMTRDPARFLADIPKVFVENSFRAQISSRSYVLSAQARNSSRSEVWFFSPVH